MVLRPVAAFVRVGDALTPVEPRRAVGLSGTPRRFRAMPLLLVAALAATMHLAGSAQAQSAADDNADPPVDRVVNGVILPAMAGFATAAAALRDAAAADCDAASEPLRAAYHAAFDAWILAAPYRLGPLETEGLAIAYWPDPKGNTQKALARALAAGGQALADPADYAQGSVAARGFFAIEAMLYDPVFDGYAPDDPGCGLLRVATADLAATAARVDAGWTGGFAALLLSAGAPGNPRFLTVAEARQALFTTVLTELEFTAEERLGRPLGTIDRPRPTRAEARLSGRSLRDVQGSLAASRAMIAALGGGDSELLPGYLDYADRVASRLVDPVLAGVDTPVGRLKIQDLQDAVRRVRETAIVELGAVLGVTAGFNALDGD